MLILETFSLKGKTALVTGGGGLYGRQIVQALAEAGARPYIASRNLDPLEELAAGHRKQGFDVRALPLDQTEETSIAAVRDGISGESGALHILVNNAVARPLEDGYFSEAAALNESMRVNDISPLRTNAQFWRCRNLLTALEISVQSRNEFHINSQDYCRVTFVAEPCRVCELYYTGRTHHARNRPLSGFSPGLIGRKGKGRPHPGRRLMGFP
jgi:hypothetical protein